MARGQMLDSARVLVTGGCGFIGSHLVRMLIQDVGVPLVVNLDALTYSGNPNNLEDVREAEQYHFVHGDIRDSVLVERLLKEERINLLFHLAAESHVDRSIKSVEPFVSTNVDGTRSLLEAIVREQSRRVTDGRESQVHLIHVSTDEVYGSLAADDPPFTEQTPLAPRNPYAATKAAADMLVQAFTNTHDLSTVITRCSNNYGSHQFPEKLIPLMTLNALVGRSLPVYGDGMQVRDWLHVSDHCWALVDVAGGLLTGTVESGEVFNIGGRNEQPNLEIVRSILELTGASEELIGHVSDRPGHDRRYAMDSRKLEQRFGWKSEVAWESGLADTVEWYRHNEAWVSDVRSGEYLEWIKRNYEGREAIG